MQAGLNSQEERDDAVRELTRSIAGGSESAFIRFYELTFDSLFRFLLVQTRGDEDLARELSQTVMLRCVQYMRPFDSERVLWAWLRQVSRNCFVDWLRRKKTQPVSIPLEICEDLAAADEKSDMSDMEELLLALDKSLEQLDPEDSAILRLAYFEKESHQKMAVQLHTTAKAVESKLGRIRLKLRRTLLQMMKDYALL